MAVNQKKLRTFVYLNISFSDLFRDWKQGYLMIFITIKINLTYLETMVFAVQDLGLIAQYCLMPGFSTIMANMFTMSSHKEVWLKMLWYFFKNSVKKSKQNSLKL
jgi:hypothetical protein